jgi:r-opsin
MDPQFSAYTWQGAQNLTVVDKVPPEMLQLVDAHWHQFPPMNPLWHSLLGFAISILCILCLTGNF